jgi:carboxymethylenebutenolidase
MGGYLAAPDAAGDHPGVLVAMELFGVDAYVREVCDDLARRGFAALAPDFHHRTDPGAELPRDEVGRARGFELLNLLTREGSSPMSVLPSGTCAGAARVWPASSG